MDDKNFEKLLKDLTKVHVEYNKLLIEAEEEYKN